MFRRILKEQRGAFMVFFAILVPLFIGMIGFAVDAGFIYMQKAKMQDIADAAALAGAARLNDGADKEGHVTSAVRAYAEANGLSGVATAMASLDESSDLPTKYDKLKILQGIQYNVTDKDGKQRDHVKVVIAKRVPTFFINVLFPDQKDGVVVKVAAAAEYVEGEEAPVSYDGPRIFSSTYTDYLYDSNTIIVNKGQDFSIYGATSAVDFNKLPAGAVGTIYHSPHNAQDAPEGWTVVRYNNTWWDETNKDEKAALDKANALYEEKGKKYTSKANAYYNDRQSYIKGEGGKRFIGYNKNGELINNIKEGDDYIDLYIDATDMSVVNKIEAGWSDPYYNTILTNSQLKGVKHINTLLLGKFGYDQYKNIHNNPWEAKRFIIATKGVTYGDVYNLHELNGCYLSGEENHFNGLVYSLGMIYIGGTNNHYNETNNTEIYTHQTHMGLCDEAVEVKSADGVVIKVTDKVNESNNPNWHIYWGASGSSSGSSGSDDSGDETKAHVRLVE